MSSLISKLFRPRTEHIPAKVADPLLGEVSFSKQFRAWVADVPIGEPIIEFVLAGDDRAPSDAVLAHAGDLVRDFAVFQGMVSEFLARQAAESPHDADEITQLRIACISLPFPDRPQDGEIGFRGPSDIRVWHARCKDGKPVSLGFDD
jgi:hypothetical protein